MTDLYAVTVYTAGSGHFSMRRALMAQIDGMLAMLSNGPYIDLIGPDGVTNTRIYSAHVTGVQWHKENA